MKYATLTIPVEITIYSQHETGIRDRDGADDADLRCGQLNGTGVASAKRFDYGTRSVNVDQQECIQGLPVVGNGPRVLSKIANEKASGVCPVSTFVVRSTRKLKMEPGLNC
jgi:hypothetical protein